MGFTELMTVVLVTLKILGYGHYSWLVAFSPELIAVAIYAIGGLIALIVLTWGKKRRRSFF